MFMFTLYLIFVMFYPEIWIDLVILSFYPMIMTFFPYSFDLFI